MSHQDENAAVLAEITPPPHKEGTFANRTLTGLVVRDFTDTTLNMDSGTIFISREISSALSVGDHILIEWIGDSGLGSRYTGLVHNGQWLKEQSDEEIREQLDRMKEKEDKLQALFAENSKDEWAELLRGLPDWLRTRGEQMHEEIGDTVEWGYALIAMCLADMYSRIGDEILDKDPFSASPLEPAEMKEFESKHGVTGNQISMGLSMAKAHLRGEI